MSFNFQRHLRLIGSVANIAGLMLHNWTLAIIGLLVMFIGYSVSIHKMEILLEALTKDKEENDAVK